MYSGLASSGRLLSGVAALIVAFATAPSPVLAQEQVRIGIGYGLAFLPTYICEDQKLVEKYAKALHLNVRASYQRFLGAGPVQDAIASGQIDVGPFGAAPLLMAWDKAKDAKDTRAQILAVSGMTTLSLDLLSNRSNVRSIADLRAGDRIAMPTLSSPQMYLLEMQSEKIFGQYDRLRGQVVKLLPADALAALIEGSGLVTAYFASPPFTQIALKDSHIRQILSSKEVIGGRASFLILGAHKDYIEAHPKIPQAIDEAMDEAARFIHDDPLRAAQIYLTHEPSKALDAADIEMVLKDNADAFGSAVEGIQAFADFLGRHGELKTPPQSWKEIVAPSLLNSSSS
jgi:NitT/TauT family transport system substrate-binding protein